MEYIIKVQKVLRPKTEDNESDYEKTVDVYEQRIEDAGASLSNLEDIIVAVNRIKPAK
jgi:hypothetical protein